MNTLSEPTLFDAIASLIPEVLRERYYARMAHMQSLDPNDQILVVCEAMGFLALIIQEAPGRVVAEREAIDAMVERLKTSITALQKDLNKLAPDIVNGIGVESIAQQIGESLRQRLHNTGLFDVSNGLKSSSNALHSALRDFNLVAHDLVDPKGGMIGKINTAVSHFDSTIGNALERLNSHASRLDQRASRHHMYLMFVGFGIMLIFGAFIGFMIARVLR